MPLRCNSTPKPMLQPQPPADGISVRKVCLWAWRGSTRTRKSHDEASTPFPFNNSLVGDDLKLNSYIEYTYRTNVFVPNTFILVNNVLLVDIVTFSHRQVHGAGRVPEQDEGKHSNSPPHDARNRIGSPEEVDQRNKVCRSA